jgi:hypothetical protein
MGLLIDRLISSWKLDEVSDGLNPVIRVDSHGTNDFTDVNTTTSSAGVVDNGAVFEDANNEYLTCSGSDFDFGDTDFTVGFWGKRDVSGQTQMFICRDGVSSDRHFWIYLNSSNQIIFTVYVGGAGYTVTGSVLNVSTWYYITAWHDSTANTINLQLNDASPVSTAHSLGVATGASQALEIGGRGGASLHFLDGMVDEVNIWSRILTSDERNELYNSGNGLSYPFGIDLKTNLISFWNLDEVSNGTAPTIRADSHGTNDFTDVNTTPSGTGIIGNGADLEDSRYEYLRCDGSDFDVGESDFSISVWIKAENPVTSGMILCRDHYPSSNRAFQLRHRSQTGGWEIWFAVFGSGSLTLQSTPTITNGVWYHIVAIRKKNDGDNNGYLKLIINDGTPDEVSHSDTMNTFVGDLTLGCYLSNGSSPTSYFDGVVDEVGFWDRVLTPEEITKLYNDGSGLSYPFEEEVVVDLETDLISFWKLDEASDGTSPVIRVDSVGSHDLTDVNTTASGVGIIENGVNLDSFNNEYLTNDDSSFNFNESFTIAGWFKFDMLGANRTLFSRYLNSGTERQYILFYEHSSTNIRLLLSHDGLNATSLYSSQSSWSIGTWYYIVAWYDDVLEEIGISINDSSVTTPATSGIYTGSTQPFLLGNSYAGFFDGVIDEVGVWSRALTSEERTQLYNSGSGLSYPFVESPEPFDLITRLLYYWPMDEVSDGSTPVTRIDSVGSHDLTDINNASSEVSIYNRGVKMNANNLQYLAKTDGTYLPYWCNITVSFWFKPENIPSPSSPGGTPIFINLEMFVVRAILETGYIEAFTNPNWDAPAGRSITFIPGMWYHVVAWYDYDNQEVGISVNDHSLPTVVSRELPLPPSHEGKYFIGGYEGTEDPWFVNGIIDEVGLWDKVLSVQERDFLYNNGNGLSYPFEEEQVINLLASSKSDSEFNTSFLFNFILNLISEGVSEAVTNPFGMKIFFDLFSSEGISEAVIPIGSMGFRKELLDILQTLGVSETSLIKINKITETTFQLQDIILVPGDVVRIDTDLLNVFINGVHDVVSVTGESVFFKLLPGKNQIVVEIDDSSVDVHFVWNSRWL